jgi:hypothetical protein
MLDDAPEPMGDAFWSKLNCRAIAEVADAQRKRHPVRIELGFEPDVIPVVEGALHAGSPHAHRYASATLQLRLEAQHTARSLAQLDISREAINHCHGFPCTLRGCLARRASMAQLRTFQNRSPAERHLDWEGCRNVRDLGACRPLVGG